MRQRGGGRLISITSIGGRQSVPGHGAHTASKCAVIGWNKEAAIELEPDNITVNAIAPGPVGTPMCRSEAQIASMGLSITVAQDAALNPMLPVGDRPALVPLELARAALLLAGPGGSSISGTSLDGALGYNAFYTS